jgi:hypothetical protein
VCRNGPPDEIKPGSGFQRYRSVTANESGQTLTKPVAVRNKEGWSLSDRECVSG